jgi:hypothetical protein
VAGLLCNQHTGLKVITLIWKELSYVWRHAYLADSKALLEDVLHLL